MTNRSAGAGRDGKLREKVETWRAQTKLTTNERVRTLLTQHADDIEAILAVPDPLASSSETQGENFNIRLGKLRESLEGSSKEMVIGLALQAIYDLNELRKSASSVPVRASGEPPEWLKNLCWTCGEAENHGWHRPQKVRGPGVNPADFHAFVPIPASASPSDDGAKR